MKIVSHRVFSLSLFFFVTMPTRRLGSEAPKQREERTPEKLFLVLLGSGILVICFTDFFFPSQSWSSRYSFARFLMPAIRNVIRRSRRLNPGPISPPPARGIHPNTNRNILIPQIIEHVNDVTTFIDMYHTLPEVREVVANETNFARLIGNFQLMKETPFVANLQAGNFVGLVNLTNRDVSRVLNNTTTAPDVWFQMNSLHQLSFKSLFEYVREIVPQIPQQTEYILLLIGYNAEKLVVLFEEWMDEYDSEYHRYHITLEFLRKKYEPDEVGFLEIDALDESLFRKDISEDQTSNDRLKEISEIIHPDSELVRDQIDQLEGKGTCPAIETCKRKFIPENITWVTGIDCD